MSLPAQALPGDEVVEALKEEPALAAAPVVRFAVERAAKSAAQPPAEPHLTAAPVSAAKSAAKPAASRGQVEAVAAQPEGENKGHSGALPGAPS